MYILLPAPGKALHPTTTSDADTAVPFANQGFDDV